MLPPGPRRRCKIPLLLSPVNGGTEIRRFTSDEIGGGCVGEDEGKELLLI